jgi:tetratricopeptide (TPR) repeat protein
MELGEFKEAFGTIQKMLQITSDPSRYATEVRFLFHSACRCYYEMGEYAQAINIGSAAVEANRHYEGVHKYIALSYQALGRYDEAILTMRRAVRYETPWDAAHVAACQALLEEIMAEKERVDAGKESEVVA